MVLPLLYLFSAHAEDAATGLLKVRSSVSGAEVYLDNALIGTVPITQIIPAGTHNLRVVADNYDPFVRKLEVAADRTTDVNATLVPGGGTVEFTGPADAVLKVDGQDKGEMPIRLRDLGPGAHTWHVEAPLFEPTEGNITIAKGKNYLITVTMPSSAGIFVVESTPPGATVILDDKAVGTAPLRLENIPLGNHTVRLDLEGYASVVRTMDTTDGKRGDIKASLPEDGAIISVITDSDQAKVLLNGVLIGTGDKVEAGPFEKGRARITVVDGATTVERSLTLPSSGKIALRLAGDSLEDVLPLTQRWGFWVAIGGVAAAGGTAAITTAVLLAPEPIPDADQVVVLP